MDTFLFASSSNSDSGAGSALAFLAGYFGSAFLIAYVASRLYEARAEKKGTYTRKKVLVFRWVAFVVVVLLVASNHNG